MLGFKVLECIDSEFPTLGLSLSLIVVVDFLGLTIQSSLKLCNPFSEVLGLILTDIYPLAAVNGYLLISHQGGPLLPHFV